MFKRIFIANRGEVAVRIIRTCRDLGIETVIGYAEPDAEQLAVMMADQAVCLGPAALAESYLNVDRILTVALATGCEAVHPGYGFLSENADFAERVAAEGLVFIGPEAAVIRRMGDKIAAREAMQEAGVPVIPGSREALADHEAALAFGEAHGYPVLLKAAAGGGGRGMRLVWEAEAMRQAFADATRESTAAFGDGRLYIERFITSAKHVEVQIIADGEGRVCHLGERDCSLQRKQQKLLEETPCRRLDPALRDAICAAAVRAAAAVGYSGVGTVEFLVTEDGAWYFMEMNTRLQVEHPITEMVSGIDLVKEQLRIASGQGLDFAQDDIVLRGHAIECRINAENPLAGFRPSVGTVSGLHLPQGPFVRVDSALLEGGEVTIYYDSLVAKVSVWGETRVEAIRRMRRALAELLIEGIDTTMELHYMILHHVDVVRGEYDSRFIDEHIDELVNIL